MNSYERCTKKLSQFQFEMYDDFAHKGHGHFCLVICKPLEKYLETML